MKKIIFAKLIIGSFLFCNLQANEEAKCGTCVSEESWGYHLILDCKACDVAAITSRDTLANFTKVIVDAIDMKSYGEPLLVHFAEHNPEAAGYSLLQFIETSSITGHFVDKNGDAYIDIFSCKPFSAEVAIGVVQKLLNPQNIKSQFITRKA